MPSSLIQQMATDRLQTSAHGLRLQLLPSRVSANCDDKLTSPRLYFELTALDG
jgi:hypothetical protein